MVKIYGLTQRDELLERTRIDELFDQGLSFPLLKVLAGPGYGKTQAAASFLSSCEDIRLIWMKLTTLDNLPESFWNNLETALQKDFPKFSQYIGKRPFPDSLGAVDAFLRELASVVYAGKKVVWVLDDFGLLENPLVLFIIRTLIEIELENFCLVLISSTKKPVDAMSAVASNKFSITGEDLQFNKQEIGALFSMHGIPLRPDVLESIHTLTEGWPLSLRMLITLYHENADEAALMSKLSNHDIDLIFEHRFFARYSPEMQKMLAMLSSLSEFPRDLLGVIYEGPDLTSLEDNGFLNYIPARNTLCFHNLYRLFLKRKSYLVSSEETLAYHKKTAAYFSKNDNHRQAMACYRMCGDHEAMIMSIANYIRNHYSVSIEDANLFIEHLDLLTEEENDRFPIASYLKAHMYLTILETGKAESILLELEQRLLDNRAHGARQLLGEVYALLGGLHMMRNQEDFGDYFKKAWSYLPNGTTLRDKGLLLTGNNHSFSMADNQPGAMERMSAAVTEGVFWASKVMNGVMSGKDSIFAAEAAYITADFVEARKHAYQAIYKAQEKSQHDLVCNAYLLLAQTALMRTDFTEMSNNIERIAEYVSRYNVYVLKEIRDTALAWYYIRLEDYARVPRWLLSLTHQNPIPLTNNRALIVFAEYLLQAGEYEELVALLENPNGLYLVSGIWHDRIRLLILLAEGYHGLQAHEKAVAAFWEAYNMCYGNDIITPFIEGGKHMRKLIQTAQRQEQYLFDPQWLDTINTKCNTYTKKLIAVQNAYNKKHGNNKTIQLSKREKEILLSLSQGLTREEIADFYAISINTVKTILTNTYSKLGAVNRADAIYIAMTEGHLG